MYDQYMKYQLEGTVLNNVCGQYMKCQLEGTMQIYKWEKALHRNTLIKSNAQSPPEGGVHNYHLREKYKYSIRERSTNTQLDGAQQTATRCRKAKPSLDTIT